jgi:hypothetical protein
LNVLAFEGYQQLPFSDIVPLAHVPSLNLAADLWDHLDVGSFYLSCNQHGRFVSKPASGYAKQNNRQTHCA